MRLAFWLGTLATIIVTGLTATVSTAGASASPEPMTGHGGGAAVTIGSNARSGAQPPGGTQLWVARYDGPGKNDANQAASLAVSPDGSTVFVTGTSRDVATSGSHAVTVAYDAATGARLWVASYYGLGVSKADSVAVSPDGSKVFITGGTGASSGIEQYATVAYNATTGASLWVQRYVAPANQGGSARGVVVSPDGSKVFVTGGVSDATGNSNLITVAYGTATGTQLWVQSYRGSLNLGSYALSAAVSPDGSKVFVVGTNIDTTGISQGVTVAYGTATGTMLWASQPQASIATSVAVSPNGSAVFVTASTRAPHPEYFTTVAYNSGTGAVLWTQLYRGPIGRSMFANSIAVSPDGSKVFVTGSAAGAVVDVADYATVAYDAATGAKLWAELYSGRSGFTGANSVAVSPDGTKVFVTGGHELANGATDYATVAYDAATGSKLWIQHYGGSLADNVAVSVVASPDGSRVFITGYSAGGAHTQFGYATLAYSP